MHLTNALIMPSLLLAPLPFDMIVKCIRKKTIYTDTGTTTQTLLTANQFATGRQQCPKF